MIEEIKKDLKELNTYLVKDAVITPNNTYINTIRTINIEKILEILDKYKDKEYTPESIKNLSREQLVQLCFFFMKTDKEKTKYVNAWIELPKMFAGTTHLGKLETCMQELEKKHKIEVE